MEVRERCSFGCNDPVSHFFFFFVKQGKVAGRHMRQPWLKRVLLTFTFTFCLKGEMRMIGHNFSLKLNNRMYERAVLTLCQRSLRIVLQLYLLK